MISCYYVLFHMHVNFTLGVCLEANAEIDQKTCELLYEKDYHVKCCVKHITAFHVKFSYIYKTM